MRPDVEAPLLQRNPQQGDAPPTSSPFARSSARPPSASRSRPAPGQPPQNPPPRDQRQKDKFVPLEFDVGEKLTVLEDVQSPHDDRGSVKGRVRTCVHASMRRDDVLPTSCR